MRALIKDLKPTKFEEIIPLIALYRPGPIEGGMVEDFVKRKNGQVEVKYELPELEPILRETHGVILYQEQVMAIANRIAGFSLAQADVLRCAMGKKKEKTMHEQKEKFISGAKAKGFSENKATHSSISAKVRWIRLQQEPLSLVLGHLLPDGVPEGELSRRVHGGASHIRHRRLR